MLDKLFMKIRNFFLAAGLFFLAANANATLYLNLDDNAGSTVTVVDDGAGDDMPITGYLDYTGAVGVWNINSITAFANPIIGDEHYDAIHLDSVNVSGSAGTLTIMLSQTDLDRTASLMAGFGGFAGGDIAFELYADSSNTEFGLGIKLFDSDSIGSGGFGDNFSTGLTFVDPYSLTMVVTISHTSKTISSFDYDVKIPEPATLSLLGMGLLAFGFATRRKKISK